MAIEVKLLAEWESSGLPDTLSVVIPAHNEEGHIEATVRTFADRLSDEDIAHEILVVNDNSTDSTREVLRRLEGEVPTLRVVDNAPPNGFGFAVRRGLAEFRGEAVAIVMADGSDAPEDLVAFYRILQQGYDCVFGSRFSRGGRTVNYPRLKYVMNRLGNTLIRLLFWLSYDDITNAFKLYRRRVIAGLQPLLSNHFSLTVELPLKSIIRGYSYAVVPNGWYTRERGLSKFSIGEMGPRYLFIILYCLLEKHLSGGDYKDNAEMRKSQLQVWPH